ncbi:MAG: hypothetical protein J0M30_14685 [Chitinophagales bacterium]|nr:hypothetical protein [Chitinophagales bacterium]
MKTGIELIAIERQEQIEKHGFTISHDKEHRDGELAINAATLTAMDTGYSVTDKYFIEYPDDWGLCDKLKNDRIHQLKVAGALIAAEIDRLQAVE